MGEKVYGKQIKNKIDGVKLQNYHSLLLKSLQTNYHNILALSTVLVYNKLIKKIIKESLC